MPDAAQNLLYYGDNLDVLRRHVGDESVDLVYLDPPFNSNADYTSPAGTRHPRLQILTVEDLLNGRTIDMPAWRDLRTFKRAPKAKAVKRERDAELF